MLSKYKNLSEVFEKAGFKVEWLEYFDENHNVISNAWDKSKCMIHKSFRYDKRNKHNPIKYTSIILDALKTSVRLLPIFLFVYNRPWYTQQTVANTCVIYWYASIFKQNVFFLNPLQTFVENIGLDGSGVYCCEVLEISNFSLNNKSEINFIKALNENKIVFKRVQNFFKKVKNKLYES